MSEALTIALIAGGAAVLGSLAGAAGSLAATWLQVRREDARRWDDRGEAAFADVLRLARRFHGPPVDPSALREFTAAVDESYRWATPEVERALDELRDALYDAVLLLQREHRQLTSRYPPLSRDQATFLAHRMWDTGQVPPDGEQGGGATLLEHIDKLRAAIRVQQGIRRRPRWRPK